MIMIINKLNQKGKFNKYSLETTINGLTNKQEFFDSYSNIVNSLQEKVPTLNKKLINKLCFNWSDKNVYIIPQQSGSCTWYSIYWIFLFKCVVDNNYENYLNQIFQIFFKFKYFTERIFEESNILKVYNNSDYKKLAYTFYDIKKIYQKFCDIGILQYKISNKIEDVIYNTTHILRLKSKNLENINHELSQYTKMISPYFNNFFTLKNVSFNDYNYTNSLVNYYFDIFKSKVIGDIREFKYYKDNIYLIGFKMFDKIGWDDDYIFFKNSKILIQDEILDNYLIKLHKELFEFETKKYLENNYYDQDQMEINNSLCEIKSNNKIQNDVNELILKLIKNKINKIVNDFNDLVDW